MYIHACICIHAQNYTCLLVGTEDEVVLKLPWENPAEIYMHVCTHVYVYTHKHIYIYRYVYTHIIHIYIYIYTYIYRYIWYTYIYTYIDIYRDIYIYRYIYMQYIHRITFVCLLWCKSSSWICKWTYACTYTFKYVNVYARYMHRHLQSHVCNGRYTNIGVAFVGLLKLWVSFAKKNHKSSFLFKKRQNRTSRVHSFLLIDDCFYYL